MAPLYTYECRECGLQTDILMRVTDPSDDVEVEHHKLHDVLPCDCTDPGDCTDHCLVPCTGKLRRIVAPVNFTFNCPMPTAPTSHHKGGNQ